VSIGNQEPVRRRSDRDLDQYEVSRSPHFLKLTLDVVAHGVCLSVEHNTRGYLVRHRVPLSIGPANLAKPPQSDPGADCRKTAGEFLSCPTNRRNTCTAIGTGQLPLRRKWSFPNFFDHGLRNKTVQVILTG